ncbi:hypothetical protein [Deinococcus ruber]|uniref:Uncharacterized protein n=1 Tax=Deinococcus ruber TaxID=1848197 RepID=A0A918CGQ4_9DEIO|nr:hypothetical protein [Deinococcus ruber]GGR21054.1 hypothetical protein GCM10008957_36650 [Deinococcus ruber]
MIVVALVALMVVMLIRMSGPRQPGMPATGTINYGTNTSPAGTTQPAPAPAPMPGMKMGGSSGK